MTHTGEREISAVSRRVGMCPYTLKGCENLKMDILDFESPCDMLNCCLD